MAVNYRERFRLIGEVPLRIVLEKLRDIATAWIVLSMILGAVFVADLFLGNAVRAAVPTIPSWAWTAALWVFFVTFLLYHWREFFRAIAEMCLQMAEMKFLVVLLVVAPLVATYFLREVSGYLVAWFWISYILLLAFVDFLDAEAQKWGEPLMDQPKSWIHGEGPLQLEEIQIPKDSDDGARLPVSPEMLRGELKRCLLIAIGGIPPSRVTRDQAEHFRDFVLGLAEGVRGACVDALIKAEEWDDPKEVVANAQLGD